MYRVHEFAELPGVTVKTLHHYDRLGLLKPTRTGWIAMRFNCRRPCDCSAAY